MPKKQLILSAVAITAVVLLFMLPKAVVDNENSGVSQAETGTSQETAEATDHTAEMPENVQAELADLREDYINNRNSENFANFANSLIEGFVSANQYDSAAKYAAELAESEAILAHLQKAGDMYYEAFTYAMDPEKGQQMGEQARYYYGKVLEQAPEQLDAKAKMAMTYVSSTNPMQGISMLREVLAADENNEMAIYNLGLLSMQSGQYDRAVERFEKLTQISPDNLQAQFLLGVSYFEAGQKEKAKVQFEAVKEMDGDPSVSASVDEYLNQL
jgi:tetratricopeptide (TPR) repeat protein